MADPTNPPEMPELEARQDASEIASDQGLAPRSDLAPAPNAHAEAKSEGGPINLERIRQMRMAQQVRPDQSREQKRKRGPKPGAPAGGAPAEAAKTSDEELSASGSNKDTAPMAPETPVVAAKVPVPSMRRRDMAEDSELEEALAGADLDKLMIGEKTGRVGVGLEDGSRYQARVIKVHNANVFVSLGGPNEGVIPVLQFTDFPSEGQIVDVVIRAFNADEGLYELAIPGEAITANDWGDLEEGAIVEVKVESANTGGVECKVGNVRGFIPISQLSEFRIESAADYIGQKLLCVITESNPRRGNLVLSHRAVLEREKAQKRAQRLEELEIGEVCEGIVRKLMDFGAFVDIGGLDGLIHISQLSWDKIKHPSEVLKEGDKVQVRIEKFDPKTGKISLSYRSQQEDPWNDVEARFPIGSTVNGTVSRLANFGAFVRLATGIEGLIHISELAHRRVNNVAQVIQEGQDVEVKILTVDRNAQRIGLSLKAMQANPESSKGQGGAPEPEDSRRESAVRKYEGQLRGGTGNSGAGELFGLKL